MQHLGHLFRISQTRCEKHGLLQTDRGPSCEKHVGRLAIPLNRRYPTSRKTKSREDSDSFSFFLKKPRLRATAVNEPALLQVLQGRTINPPPLWLMRQAGRYLAEYRELRAKAASFLDLCYTPKHATEVTLQPIRRFGLDAAILFSDILVVPDALGQKVAFKEGEGPVLDAFDSEAGLAKLSRQGFLDHLSPVFEAIDLIRGALAPETALIGFCGAPWTVATYMVGGRGSSDQAAARGWAYRDRKGFSKLIDLLVEVSAEYLSAQIEAGVQAVQIFDSWAGNLPEGEFRRWSMAPAKAIVEHVKAAHPDVPIIGFPRGAGPLYRDYIRETGVDAVSCDTSLPVSFIRDELQPHATVQGNLDPLALVAGGPVMEEAVAEILEMLAKGPFIFNLGHGIVPQTPPEHVARLVELVRGGKG
jgi:uroporphyrinogen decarboxylase